MSPGREDGKTVIREPLTPSRLQNQAGFDPEAVSQLNYHYKLVTSADPESRPTITEQDRFKAFSLEFQNSLIWLITQFNLKSLNEIMVFDPTSMVTSVIDDGLVFDPDGNNNEDEPQQPTPLKKIIVEGKDLSNFYLNLLSQKKINAQEHMGMLPFISAMIETELKKYPTQPRVIMIPRILPRETNFQKLFEAIAIKFNLDAIVFPITDTYAKEDNSFGAYDVYDGLLDIRNPKKYPTNKNLRQIDGFPHFVQHTLQRLLQYTSTQKINLKDGIPFTTPIGQEAFISKPNDNDKREYKITLKSPTLSNFDWNPEQITESSIHFRIESDGIIKILWCNRMPNQHLQGTMIDICLAIEEQLAGYTK